MKFALLLIALFAVVCICQAYPQPAEDANAQGAQAPQGAQASQGAQGQEQASSSKSEAEIIAELKANPKGRFWGALASIVGNLVVNWINRG